MRDTLRLATLLALAPMLALACSAEAKDPERAAALRNQGLAELENERPADAEKTFAQLARLLPADPLPHANLAVALLRQQKTDEALAAVDRALQVAPESGGLQALRGEILQWAGRDEEAVELLVRAAKAAPDDPEIQFALLRGASNLASAGAEAAATTALERLRRLRPENVVVLLELGKAAIAAGDRATATGAYQRIRELVWQAPPIAGESLDLLLEALEGPEVSAARIPAIRLENVLKVTPMFRESLRELDTGIQGIPLWRFAGEEEATVWGDASAAITFAGTSWSDQPAVGRALAVGDWDGDDRPDVAWIRSGEPPILELRSGARPTTPSVELPAPGLERLAALDLDNDGHLDLVGIGPGTAQAFRGDGTGTLTPSDLLDRSARGVDVAALDFDIEGDLDLVTTGGDRAPELLLNRLDGPLEPVGDRTLPTLVGTVRALVPTDLDRDGDLDLVVARDDQIELLDNLRQGRFVLGENAFGAGPGPVAALASADLDRDGRPEIVGAGSAVGSPGRATLTIWHGTESRFEPSPVAAAEAPGEGWQAVATGDWDNDGTTDLAVAGPAGVRALGQTDDGFRRLETADAPTTATAIRAADLDGDGDLDLVVAGPEGLSRLENRGGDTNRWLVVRLRGLTEGNSKNNSRGLGSTVEIRSGRAYQFQEAQGDVVHFGLGRVREPDVLRVEWTNGVPQNRINPSTNQRVVEEQLLKGSCPFLYTWTGREVEFVTDLLWGAPIGLPVAPGVWAGADPRELVAVRGARPRDGVYDLRITEELWEAAHFDEVRLWVVDHPVEVDVASALRIVPGQETPERVLGSRDLRPPIAAWDGGGADVTERVARRDDVYADGYRESRYQGVAAAPWSLVFDLGAAPGEPIRLHLDGWIFPSDASLNLAVAQRDDLVPLPPRLEVETARGWQPLVPAMGFPAGKTKTMVVETPALPEGAHRLRITTSLWIGWDRIAWTTNPADDEPRIVARLEPSRAELAVRGFSRLERKSPNGPHHFVYADVTTDSPWRSFPGHYTRLGDVRELLAATDDRLVVLASGDELRLEFPTGSLPAPPPGFERTVFLESYGWDKDADRNTWEAARLEPLPFSGMSGYPWSEGENYPDDPELDRYRTEWLTRRID